MELEKAILIALLRGAESSKDIAEILNVDEKSVEEAMRRLEAKGLARCEEKGFLFLKKVVCKLTELGYNYANEALEELKRKAEEIKRIIETTPPEERQEVVRKVIAEDYTLSYLLPLMMWMGFIVPDILTVLALNEVLADNYGDESYEEYGNIGDSEGIEDHGEDFDIGDLGGDSDIGDMM